jgi:hypothetical protein
MMNFFHLWIISSIFVQVEEVILPMRSHRDSRASSQETLKWTNASIYDRTHLFTDACIYLRMKEKQKWIFDGTTIPTWKINSFWMIAQTQPSTTRQQTVLPACFMRRSINSRLLIQ